MGMSKHYTKQERRIDIEFRPSNRATAHGGQFGMNGLAHEFGLWDRVKKDRRLDPRTHCGKGFDPCVYVAAFIFSFTSGGDSLADAGRLDDDDSLKAILGVEKFPDETALGEWLRNIGDEGAAALREIVQEFVQWALGRAKSERLLHAGQLESFFDDTQLEVSGQCFEGAKLNYAGKVALSWQTLWVGPFVVDGVVGSPADHKEPLSSGETGNDVSAWLPEMIERNKHLWAGQTSYLYADSASSAGKYLEAIEEGFDQYTVSYNRWTRALDRNASLLPEVAWSKEQIIRWRDGHDHLTQYARLRYRPAGCEKNKLYAVCRHRRADGELFWNYNFVACDPSRTEGPAEAIFERHRLKGDYERRFGELLIDLGLHHPPCKSLAANNVYYQLGMLAFNMLQAMKLLYLPDEHQPKRVRTIIHHLLLIPVEIKRHARQLKAVCFVAAGWIQWWRDFLHELVPAYRLLGCT
jgi:hypothetical protein